MYPPHGTLWQEDAAKATELSTCDESDVTSPGQAPIEAWYLSESPSSEKTAKTRTRKGPYSQSRTRRPKEVPVHEEHSFQALQLKHATGVSFCQ